MNLADPALKLNTVIQHYITAASLSFVFHTLSFTARDITSLNLWNWLMQMVTHDCWFPLSVSQSFKDVFYFLYANGSRRPKEQVREFSFFGDLFLDLYSLLCLWLENWWKNTFASTILEIKKNKNKKNELRVFSSNKNRRENNVDQADKMDAEEKKKKSSPAPQGFYKCTAVTDKFITEMWTLDEVRFKILIHFCWFIRIIGFLSCFARNKIDIERAPL